MSGRGGTSGIGASLVEDFWLTTASGTVGATWYWPVGEVDADAVGVVIVPGIAHEEQTMAVGLVALARELSHRGMPALLIDLAGTAQGSGSLGDSDVGQRWDDDVRAAVGHLRDAGLRHIAVVGVRLGVLIAAHALVDDPVDLMVMWAPVLSGRRYVRELQMMQGTATGAVGGALPGITVAGFNFPPDLVSHLRSLDAAKLDGKPASRLCLVDSAPRLDLVDADHPLFAALPVDRLVAPDTEGWLFTKADAFAAPFGDLGGIADRIDASLPSLDDPAGSDMVPPPQLPDLTASRTVVMHQDGVAIRETFVRFGQPAFGRSDANGAGTATGVLTGVLSEPLGPPDLRRCVVAVTTVGPGRVFVDLARRNAARGRTTLRFNLSGFGSSSRLPDEAWADFYHPASPAEIGAAIDHVRALGYASVSVVGFCAGAWSAFRMPPRADVTRIVAVNAQLMIRSRLPHRQIWPDVPRRQQLLARVAQHPQVHLAVERFERHHPLPSPVLRWLGRHVSSGTPVSLLFAEGDEGLTYLRRCGTRPFGSGRRGRPDVTVYDDLGHLPSGPARDRMIADIYDLTS